MCPRSPWLRSGASVFLPPWVLDRIWTFHGTSRPGVRGQIVRADREASIVRATEAEEVIANLLENDTPEAHEKPEKSKRKSTAKRTTAKKNQLPSGTMAKKVDRIVNPSSNTVDFNLEVPSSNTVDFEVDTSETGQDEISENEDEEDTGEESEDEEKYDNDDLSGLLENDTPEAHEKPEKSKRKSTAKRKQDSTKKQRKPRKLKTVPLPPTGEDHSKSHSKVIASVDSDFEDSFSEIESGFEYAKFNVFS